MAIVGDRLPRSIVLEYILGFWRNCELGKSLVESEDLTRWLGIDSVCAISLRNFRGLCVDLDIAEPRFRTDEQQCPLA